MTTPTVRAPISSRAISATMGAAPVPVPPPSPAVTKTMSASASASRISARLSSRPDSPPGVGAGTEATGQLLADVDGLIGIGHEKGLAVSVHGDELHAAHAGFHHAVHGVRAAAADTDDLDDGQMFRAWNVRHFVLHTCCVLLLRLSRFRAPLLGRALRSAQRRHLCRILYTMPIRLQRKSPPKEPADTRIRQETHRIAASRNRQSGASGYGFFSKSEGREPPLQVIRAPRSTKGSFSAANREL